jgi:hypothetical protein
LQEQTLGIGERHDVLCHLRLQFRALTRSRFGAIILVSGLGERRIVLCGHSLSRRV